MVFENEANVDLRRDIETLPQRMQNPFTVIRRWLKFEILDLAAILEAIEKKSEMEKRRNQKIVQRNKDKNEL